MSEERLLKLNDDLLLLTGQTMEELFPQELRDECQKHSGPLVYEREMKVRTLALEDYHEREIKRLTLDDPAVEIDKRSIIDSLKDAMKKLSWREREIIKLRYGLGDGYSYTLEEVGHIFKLQRERVRQIEAKAIRKLQQPSCTRHLENWVEAPEEEEEEPPLRSPLSIAKD